MKDLINRQDAINALTEANLKRHMDSVEGGQENRSAIRIIMELPSAEPTKLHVDHALTEEEIKNLKQKIADAPIVLMPSVERKGKWVVDDEFIDCSACRKEKWSRDLFEDLVKHFRYCPNCGARMNEGAEDDEGRSN